MYIDIMIYLYLGKNLCGIPQGILKTTFLKPLGHKGIPGGYPKPRLQRIRQAK